MERVGKPYFCPFCGGTNLLADDPVEIQAEEELWIIYHWICEDCGEYFNKVIILPEKREPPLQKDYWD